VKGLTDNMPKIQAPVRIRLEDFTAEERNLAEKIGNAYNTFNEDVYNVLNGNVDFDNLAQAVTLVDVEMATGGSLAVPTSIRSGIGRVSGILCVSALNLADSTVYPTGTPFVSFSQEGQVVRLQNIAGLQDNSRYRLTLLLI
jgi:hypothetical protein